MTIENPPPETRTALDRAAVFLATCAYTSLIPYALVRHLPARWDLSKWSGCGLMGSICGTLTYLLLPLSWARSPIALAAGVLVAVAISGRAERVYGRHDDTRIVIDEWIGAWIAGAGTVHAWGIPLVLSFILFRVFDVLKGPLAPLQSLPGGWGVTLDDVGAGLITFLIMRFVPHLHGA